MLAHENCFLTPRLQLKQDKSMHTVDNIAQEFYIRSVAFMWISKMIKSSILHEKISKFRSREHNSRLIHRYTWSQDTTSTLFCDHVKIAQGQTPV